MKLASLQEKKLPEPLSLKALLGPSFILLGLGLGSGELILWPYLVANWGLGIIWGAFLGITFQFFINMEIERYALIKGESIFVGIARKIGRISPVWFILSTFLPWMWPGIIASSAKIFSSLFGFTTHREIAILLLILIGLILTLGPTLYKTVEKFQMTLIMIGVPLTFLIVLGTVNFSQIIDLLKGLAGNGNGYKFLPKGIPLASFLAAFAYTGAGGNLNLAQSFYIKEKGYGMGKYSGRITSLLTGKKELITLEGATFTVNEKNINLFKRWWKIINIEHLLVFWGAGLFTVLLLSLLSYSNTYGLEGIDASINFILTEALVIGGKLSPFVGLSFLVISGVFLFATQLTVFDATSRIMAENLIIFSQKKFPISKLSLYFYSFLWIQIISGIAIFSLGISEPLTLLTLGGVLNAVAMFVHIGLTLWVNLTSLEPPLRPSIFRISLVFLSLLFFGGFSLFILIS